VRLIIDWLPANTVLNSYELQVLLGERTIMLKQAVRRRKHKNYVCARELYLRILYGHMIKLFFSTIFHCEGGHL
jgi:hypothetical protein